MRCEIIADLSFVVLYLTLWFMAMFQSTLQIRHPQQTPPKATQVANYGIACTKAGEELLQSSCEGFDSTSIPPFSECSSGGRAGALGASGRDFKIPHSDQIMSKPKTVTLTCSFCEKEFEKYTNEYNRCIRNNQVNFYCSPFCSQKLTKPPLKEKVIKTCKTCGIDFVLQKKTSQVFCSNVCSSVSRKLAKECLSCFKEIHHKNDSGYCRSCKITTDYQFYIDRWLLGLESGNRKGVTQDLHEYVRRYMFKLHENKCQECGWSKINPITGNIPLQVDHIDGNSKDSQFNNLKLLCPCCHSLTPTYGSLNRGNGRKNRKQNDLSN